MHQVLLYLLRSSKPLVPEEEIADMLQWEQLDWQKYAEECKGMIVTNPGMVREASASLSVALSSFFSSSAVLNPASAGERVFFLLLTCDIRNLLCYPPQAVVISPV